MNTLARAPGACTVNTSDTFTGSGALGYPNVPVGTKRPVACASCGHGSHMLPYLVGLYGARSVIEVGVCTGASVVSVLKTHGDSIASYTAVDPWGERRCNPAAGALRRCGPSRPLSSAQAAPRVQRARRASHPRRLCRPCAHLCSPSRHPPPCQRQIKLLAASSFGRPLAAAGLGQPRPSGTYVLAGRPHRPLLHTGVHRRSARLHECAPGRPCVLVEGEAERRARRPRLQSPPQLGGHP